MIMTLILDISPETESRLRAEAAAQGKEISAYVEDMVSQRRAPYVLTPEGRLAWRTLFDDMEEGDAEEQRNALEQLKADFAQDRPGQRNLFGPGNYPLSNAT